MFYSALLHQKPLENHDFVAIYVGVHSDALDARTTMPETQEYTVGTMDFSYLYCSVFQEYCQISKPFQILEKMPVWIPRDISEIKPGKRFNT